MPAWYTADTPEAQQRVRAAWADAPVQNAELLGMLLTVARGQVLGYGIEAPEPEVPDRFVLAQLMQARNLWNAGRTTGDGEVGSDGFVFRPMPLDKTIRLVIRPIDGKPHAL